MKTYAKRILYRTYLFRSLMRAKVLPQREHLWGRSLVWTHRTCCLRCVAVLNPLPHFVQRCGLSPAMAMAAAAVSAACWNCCNNSKCQQERLFVRLVSVFNLKQDFHKTHWVAANGKTWPWAWINSLPKPYQRVQQSFTQDTFGGWHLSCR